MDGLVLPVLLFMAAISAVAVKAGAVPALRRWWGDFRLQQTLRRELPASHYRILRAVHLPGVQAGAPLDRLILSPYGVFVVRAIHHAGVVSGSAGDKHWRVNSRRAGAVQLPNPLLDCLAQVKMLRALLRLDPSLLHFVVVFTGNARFGGPKPTNVTLLDGLPLFIEGRDQLLIDFDEVDRLASRVVAAQQLHCEQTARRTFEAAPQ